MDKLFFIRNILNGVFILLAAICMVGYYFSKTQVAQNIFIAMGIVAVIIKIVEACLRMPNMTRKTNYEQRRYHKRGNTSL